MRILFNKNKTNKINKISILNSAVRSWHEVRPLHAGCPIREYPHVATSLRGKNSLFIFKKKHSPNSINWTTQKEEEGHSTVSLSYLDSHVTRFLLCCHSIRFKSRNEQGGATVEIKSRDCSSWLMEWMTHDDVFFMVRNGSTAINPRPDRRKQSSLTYCEIHGNGFEREFDFYVRRKKWA